MRFLILNEVRHISSFCYAALKEGYSAVCSIFIATTLATMPTSIGIRVMKYHINTIRYDTRCYFNVRSKANMSQLNLPHVTLLACILQLSVNERFTIRCGLLLQMKRGLSLCLLVTTMSCAKTAEPIEIPLLVDWWDQATIYFYVLQNNNVNFNLTAN